jgi:predicted S18 family serine protease
MFRRWVLMQAILPVVMVVALVACGGSQQPQVQQPTAPAVQATDVPQPTVAPAPTKVPAAAPPAGRKLTILS